MVNDEWRTPIDSHRNNEVKTASTAGSINYINNWQLFSTFTPQK